MMKSVNNIGTFAILNYGRKDKNDVSMRNRFLYDE